MRTFWIIIILNLTFISSALANYFDGYFIDNLDKRTECHIQMFEGMDENIIYKINKSGSKLKVKSSEIKEIGLYSENSEEETIIYRKYKAKYFSVIGSKLKNYELEVWAYQAFVSENIEAYFSPFIEVEVAFANHRTYQSFKGFVRLTSDDFLIQCYEIEDGLDPFKVYDKHMRKLFIKIIGNTCPEMSEKVEKLKYKCEDFIKMVEDYSKTCK